MRVFSTGLVGALTLALAVPAVAATPRDLLINAAFNQTDKAAALATVKQALAQAQTQLAANPGDKESALAVAIATGYRSKLTRSPADAKQSRQLLEALATSNPRDPEIQLMLGGWHLDAIAAGFLATTVLGAKKADGLAHMNQAIAFGGNRAFFRGFAAMMTIRLDPNDVAAARALAESASAGTTPTPLDRIGKRDADQLLVPLRAGDGKTAAALAVRLLPFGKLQ